MHGITVLRPPTRALRLVAALALCVAGVCACFGSPYGATSESPPGGDAGVGEGSVNPEAGSPEGAPTCVDVEADPANCGRCGHSCLGGTCTAGQCQPIELASFMDQPTATVVLSATHVFWQTIEGFASGPGKVYSCPKMGCPGGITTLPVNGNFIRGLTSDGDQKVYGGAFYANGGLFELGPTTVTQKLDLAQAGSPLQMSVRPNALFYVAFYDPDGNGRTVREWDYAGNVTKRCVLSSPDNNNTTAAAFTTSRVYLAGNNTGNLLSCLLIGNGGQFTVHRSNVYLGSIAATTDRVFWTENGSVTSSADGETSTSLRTELGAADLGGSDATSVTFSGGDLFVTTAGGELWSCNPNDCKRTRRKLATAGAVEMFHPFVSHTVAAGAVAVYFVTVDVVAGGGRGTSHLMKVAR